MKIPLKRLSLASISLLFALSTLVAVPVFAEGSDSGSTGDSVTTSSPEPSATPSADSGTGSKESGSSGRPVTETENEFKTGGKTLLAGLLAHGKKHSEAERQKFCSLHKQTMSKSFGNINNLLAKYQTRIDGVLTKAQAYQKDNDVSVANWSTLLATATAAQTTSANAIASLKALTPTLDCTSTGVVSSLATFRAGAKTARQDLKGYHDAVKALVHALIEAKTTGTPSPSPEASPKSGGNQ